MAAFDLFIFFMMEMATLNFTRQERDSSCRPTDYWLD
jgi:hypothetical protein